MMGQTGEPEIANLLEREAITINNHLLASRLSGKRILITGAAGSIGVEIVRQVLNYKPEILILCDYAESALHDIQLEAAEKFPGAIIAIFIANIQNFQRMQLLFNSYRPQIIFHAAAYKHVPMMELHPTEAILTNVLGTMNLAILATLVDAEKFVLISTDKAVNPGNVMGTSKRIAEMYIQSLGGLPENILESIHSKNNVESRDAYPGTKFMTIRLGNVLDTSGSVLPRFRSQIQNGGPVTVTDPEITRYFMLIPEAAQLVLEAGVMGQGGEIFILDMGLPVKILDLARKMIRMAGLEPEKDIKIVFTGLRPGEKLYEELFSEHEKSIPTYNDKVKISTSVRYPFSKISEDIEELLKYCHAGNNILLIKKMEEMVPEYTHTNHELMMQEVPHFR